MRRLIAVVAALALSGCGESESERGQRLRDEAYIGMLVKAEATANARFDRVEYPACDFAVSPPKKVTACGRRVFEVALANCSQRVMAWTGAGSVMLDEFAGASWIKTAGSGTVRSIDERLNTILYPSPTEFIAVLEGGGSADVITYGCELDNGLRLRHIYLGDRKTNLH